jgi:hypothetical protein
MANGRKPCLASMQRNLNWVQLLGATERKSRPSQEKQYVRWRELADKVSTEH